MAATTDSLNQTIEATTQELGRTVWRRLEHRKPSILDRRWWEDRMLEWAMADESVKVQMFRFVDVLPMLRHHEQITRHLEEYFNEVRSHLPLAVRLGLDVSHSNRFTSKALALRARANVVQMANRFIAGSNVDEVLSSVSELREQGFAFTLDLLGEAIITEREADAYQRSYLELIEGLSPAVSQWPDHDVLDWNHEGSIPRVNASLKLSALYSQFRPIAPAATRKAVAARLRPLLQAAIEHDAYVHIDMEQYEYKDLTLDIFKRVMMEPEFRDYPHVGIVVQAYLPDAERDLQDLLDWARKRGTPINVRLVKGAYWDFETIRCASRNWPIPVYRQKWQSDENFERQTRFLMENHEWLRPAIASHNVRSLAHAVSTARHLDVPSGAYELQMLYGMGRDLAQCFSEMDLRVRVYTPFGELIPGMAYLVRRLLENTSNDSFLRQGFTEHVSIEDLLMKPADIGARTPVAAPEEPHGFQNEPHSDFSRAEVRDAMVEAIESVRSELGQDYSLVINGRAVDTPDMLVSRNPSNQSEIVGQVCAASTDHVSDAIDAARRAFRDWSRTEVEHRAEYLELVAAEMRNHRFELAAWEILECGKPWAEADADVAEAIDFCMYYAAEMRRLDNPRQCDVPGEENSYFYRPRGVAVVIAPWNFPLAILTGMTVAALVTGNTVVMKPAEQSSVIGAKLMEIFQNAGLPDGVVNFLPGQGEEIGPELVGSPDVDVIAFTGSLPVGLEINRRAADTDDRQRNVKRVIAEMGGKNSIIVDDDADLDEAVLGVIHSAFGYAGQKCSACSRVIVLSAAYDAFVERVTEAVMSLKVGPADKPDSFVGPVIDEDAMNRIQEYIRVGQEECTTAASVDVKKLARKGWFVGPHVFTDIDPDHPLAKDEIFGPVLAVFRVESMDEAIKLANDTDYALTGGIYSRSPANLRRARQELEVGNLYLNREITGALVNRHPFGGFRMSGIGSKAGGPDYLIQFLIPVNVTENTMRRGFAPPPDPAN